jgi:hypothetical protein
VLASYLEDQIQAISGVTFKEWVELKATLHAIEDNRFNCQKCLSQYQGRPDGEQMLAKARANKGCQELKTQPIHKIGNEISFRTCIGNFVRPQVYGYLEAFRRYEQGVMPYSGGLFEQPAKIIDVFGVISMHQAEKAQAEHRKMEMIARQNGGRRG